MCYFELESNLLSRVLRLVSDSLPLYDLMYIDRQIDRQIDVYQDIQRQAVYLDGSGDDDDGGGDGGGIMFSLTKFVETEFFQSKF